MSKYYFTFGSSEGFPYKNTYLVIFAEDVYDARETFRSKYPNKNNCINCSFYYSENEWKEFGLKFYLAPPCEVIISNKITDKCLNRSECFLYVPEMDEIVYISEGTGDNLLQEDIENGCVDYVNYTRYAMDNGLEEYDGGMILLKETFEEKYRNASESIPDVFDLAYGNKLIDFVILR